MWRRARCAGRPIRCWTGPQQKDLNWVSPETRPFRADPRFHPILVRLRLVDLYQKYGPPDGCEIKDGEVKCR
jgi:hypothetical protein